MISVIFISAAALAGKGREKAQVQALDRIGKALRRLRKRQVQAGGEDKRQGEDEYAHGYLLSPFRR